MKRSLLISLSISLTCLFSFLNAQPFYSPVPDSLFQDRGEVYFSFSVQHINDIQILTRIISIDKVSGKEVFAYANRKEFSEFLNLNIAYSILPHPGSLLREDELNPYLKSGQPYNRLLWDFYPSYDEYLSFMAGFASAYPDICKLDTVGESSEGRLILAVKISDNVQQEEPEPQFLYTSSIHGDETTGYVLMLHLIDYLLTNYETNSGVSDLINNIEIFINPLANPDGTYHGGNNSVYGAIRYNSNSVDLNRNFPDPKLGQHPDGNPWQAETEAWMNYAQNHHFSLSANFHGGAEVFNYPWDTWSKLTADDNWWQFVGREWADTVHKYGPSGYFTDLDNGITNGYAWYELNGGRQDYMNYWHHCREVTVEISNVKMPPASQLPGFWNYNYNSFLNFISQSRYGFMGMITDTVTDLPLEARVFIQSHDIDNSEVFSRLPTGFFTRPIFGGNYDVTLAAPGYYTKTIADVNVTNRAATALNAELRPLTYSILDKYTHAAMVFPNPSDGHFRLGLPDGSKNNPGSIQVINSEGTVIYSEKIEAKPGLSSVDIDLSFLSSGLYFLKFNSGDQIFLDKIIIDLR